MGKKSYVKVSDSFTPKKTLRPMCKIFTLVPTNGKSYFFSGCTVWRRDLVY